MSYIALHLRRSLFYLMCSVFFPELEKDKILTSIVFLFVHLLIFFVCVGSLYWCCELSSKMASAFFLFVGFGSLFSPFINTD